MARQKIERIILFAMVLGIGWLCHASAGEEPHSQEWLGTGPIYGYGNFQFPYYNTYFPYYSYYYPDPGKNPPIYSSPSTYSAGFWNGFKPYRYDEPYWTLPYTSPFISDLKLRHPFEPWWVGAHRDLPKVLDIARYGSSVKVYSNGAWQPP